MNANYLDVKEGATTVRPPAFAELLVDSSDRYGAQNPSNRANDENSLLRREIENKIPSNNFEFQKNQSQLQGYFTRIGITDLEIDWRTPNINDRNGEVFMSFYSFASPSTIKQENVYFPINGYVSDFLDGDQIAANIQGAFDSFSTNGLFSSIGIDNCVCTWYPSTAQLGFSNIGGSVATASTSFAFMTKDAVDDYTSLVTRETAGWRFLKTIGATPDFLETRTVAGGNISTIGANNDVLGQPTNLAYTNYVDIVSNQLTKYARVKDSMTRLENPQQSVVARVYMNAYNTNNPMVNSQAILPHTISVDFTTPKYIRWNPAEYLNNFDLALFDEYGDPLFWTPQWSTEYRFTIQASES